jgi:hypothetical protein
MTGILEGIAINVGSQLLGNLFGGLFGRKKKPQEDPNVAYLRQVMGKAMGLGLEQAQQLIPLFKQEAEAEQRRYLENYGAYKEAVSRLTQALETPFVPNLRETLRDVSQSESAQMSRLVSAGLSPAMAEAIAKAQSEDQYFNAKEKLREAKLNQQIQATNAIGSLLGYSSAPMTALSGLSSLVSGLLSAGTGGYSQALQISEQQKALDAQMKAQRDATMSQLASMLGAMYYDYKNNRGVK